MLQETQMSNLTNFRASVLLIVALIQEHNMLHFLYISVDQFGFYNWGGYKIDYQINIFQ